MEKEFYNGQPLIVKNTKERVTFAYVDRGCRIPYNVLKKDGDGHCDEYYDYEDLEPSTEFKFSEIIAGLEQGYFEVGTKFIVLNTERTIKVGQGGSGLYLEWPSELLVLSSKDINSTWQLVEPRKEMTLEEIESELGYKIKLK